MCTQLLCKMYILLWVVIKKIGNHWIRFPLKSLSTHYNIILLSFHVQFDFYQWLRSVAELLVFFLCGEHWRGPGGRRKVIFDVCSQEDTVD